MSDDTILSPNGKQWHVKHRSWCVKRYFEIRSYVKIRAEFLHVFQTDRAPNKSRIAQWVKNFNKFGTVQNLNKQAEDRESHSGRKRLRNEALITRVQDDVECSPKRSSRQRCQALGITRSTLLRVMNEDLKQFPYRIQTKHKLTANDKRRRQAMAEALMDKIENNKSFLPYLWTSDEAHFHLDGQVNSKNNVFWGSEPPTEVREKPLHSKKVTAWCALSTLGCIGPFFFQEKRTTVTINKERYIEVLEKFWKELETRFPGYLPKIWFQQDGATPHTALITREWLRNHFKRRIISKDFPQEWSPNSPDLSPPDFFLWGYLKDRVYQEKPRTLAHLQKKIRDEVKAIKPEVFKNVMNNFCLRLKKCKDLKGAHLEHLL